MKNPYKSDFVRNKGREKVYKYISAVAGLMLVFNMSFLGVFFVAEPTVVADEPDNMCDAELDVVLIMDRSGSMVHGECTYWTGYEYETIFQSETWCDGHSSTAYPSTYVAPTTTKLESAQNAANDFLDLLGDDDQSGLVSFASEVSDPIDQPLTFSHSSTQSAVDALMAGGATNIGDAILAANSELNVLTGNAREAATKVAILLTDGKATKPNGNGMDENQADIDHAINSVIPKDESGHLIFTIGLGEDVNETMLQEIATISGGTYYSAATQDALEDIYDQIAEEVCDYGSISGCKYEGREAGGDDTLDGWTIYLTNDDDVNRHEETIDGCYSFTELPADTYIITEKEEDGWVQSYPSEGYYEIELGVGEVVENVDFANYQPTGSSISGCKYKDVEDIGIINDTEETLDDWEITLFQCPLPPLEEGESTLMKDFDVANLDSGLPGGCVSVATTNTVDGCYSFEGLDAGDYGVAETWQTSWDQTCPADNSAYYMNVGEDELVEDVDFANHEFIGSTITGCKYEDVDNLGVIDSGEETLDGWDITLFRCPFSPLGEGESTLLSDFDVANLDSGLPGGCVSVATQATVDGCYSFSGLTEGDYGVAETRAGGWDQTYPADNSAYYMNIGDEVTVEDVNFANYETDDIVIKAYKVVCELEEYLPDWAGAGTGVGDEPEFIDADTAQAYVDAINDEMDDEVCVLADDWYFQWGLDEDVLAEDGTLVGPSSDPDWNMFDSPTSGSDPAEAVVPDTEGTGIWVRENLQTDYIPFSDVLGPTEDDYSAEIYCHRDIENYDNYDLIAEPESGATYYCVAFNTLDEVVEDPGSISGYKYEDGDGDKETTSDQTPGEGWTIELYTAGDTGTVLDTTVTDEFGYFEFTDLTPGEYSLDEVMLSGNWTQLSTPEAIIDVEENEMNEDNNFVNYYEEKERTYCGDGTKQTPNDVGTGGPENDGYEECDGDDGVPDDDKYSCNSSCVLKKDSGGGGGGRSYIFENKTEEEELGPEVLGEEGSPVLSLEKSALQTLLNPGDKDIEFTITVTNNGNLTAYNVVVSDVLPEGMTYSIDASTEKIWELGDMEPGDTEVITYLSDLSDEATGGEYVNIATASADNNEPVSSEATVNVEEVEVLAETGFSTSEMMVLVSITLTLMLSTAFLKRKVLV